MSQAGSRCQYIRVLYWRDASLNTSEFCIGGMHLSIYQNFVLEGCISQHIKVRVLYWRDASLNTSKFVLEGCISQYIRVLYWRDASLNTSSLYIERCILPIHQSFVLEGCISLYKLHYPTVSEGCISQYTNSIFFCC